MSLAIVTVHPPTHLRAPERACALNQRWITEYERWVEGVGLRGRRRRERDGERERQRE